MCIQINTATMNVRNNAVRSNTNIVANTVSNSKENFAMNAAVQTPARHMSFVALRAATLFLLFGLLALCHSAARADVVIDKFVGPQQAIGVTPGTTAMQLKVRNTNNFTVSGVKIQTSIYFPTDIPLYVFGKATVRANPASSAFSLGPQQSAWITIPIPAQSLQGQALMGKYLYARATVGSQQYWLQNFLNSPAQANVQPGNPTVIGMVNGAKNVSITFTNNGYADSTAQTVTIVTWLYADGQVGPAKTQTLSLPALQVGQSVTKTFLTQPTQGYDIKGTIKVGSGNPVNFSL